MPVIPVPSIPAIFLACLASLGFGAGPALASDARKDLPGVEGGYRIVKPLEEVLEPEPDIPPRADGAVKIGDWDVRISGSVIVDIGTTKPGTGR